MFEILNKVLSVIPGNGKKTVRGISVFALSTAIKFVGDKYLPVQPSDEIIDFAVNNIVSGVELVAAATQALGLGTAIVGIVHKGVKKKLGIKK